MKKAKITRLGSVLEHGHAHHEEHDLYSRRTFMGQMGLLGGMGLMLGSLPIRAMGLSSLAKAFQGGDEDDDRILVLIQLKGGNDGLNTMIPMYDYDFYRNQRPTLGIPQQKLIQLGDEIAMPDFMSDLHPLWQEGKMKVVHSVGYNEQNLSHFRSTDIWSTASDSSETLETGWLGRLLTNENPDIFNSPPPMPPAIQIGAQGNKVFNGSLINMAVSVTDPEQLFEIAQNGELYDTQALPASCYGEELRYMRLIANNTFTYAGAIQEAYNASATSVDYGTVTNLGDQLAIVARLIKGNLGTKLYLVSLDGFDTHSEQESDHSMLMNDIAKSVSRFFEDLQQTNQDSNVLAMTFSEFGRRIEENGSLGTDHGSAAPVMLFGSGLDGSGFTGTRPDLRQPDEFGNLAYHTDFRSIYATVLQDWLCMDAVTVDTVMGAHYERIEGLVLPCGAVPFPGSTPEGQAFAHEVRYGEGTYLFFNIPEDSRVRVELFTRDGRSLGTILDQDRPKGSHQIQLGGLRKRLGTGSYFYSISALGEQYSRIFVIM